MSKLINFFFSFDKLMKEGLVRAFFWLGLLNIALRAASEMLDAIKLDWFAALVDFINFFAEVLLAVVVLRLLAELAIALFRINDNLSPDGGKSETADIDPVKEARLAAEQAAKRAQDVTKSAVERTSAATKTATEKSKTAAQDLGAKVKPQVKAVPKSAATKPASTKPAAVKSTTPTKKTDKTAPKKTAAKKTAAKKAAPKKVAVKKTASKTATKKTTAKKSTAKKATTKTTRKTK